jgi:hypothetical protein
MNGQGPKRRRADGPFHSFGHGRLSECGHAISRRAAALVQITSLGMFDATYGNAETGGEETLGGGKRRGAPFTKPDHLISSTSFRASPNNA